MVAFGEPIIETGRWVRVLYEFLGTTIVVFAGLSVVAVNGGILEAHAFAEGFIWFTALTLFLLFGAGHFNPVITLVIMVIVWLFPPRNQTQRRFPWIYLVFIVAQYLGAFVAALFTWWLTSSRTYAGLGMPLIGVGFSVGNAIGAEILGSMLITFLYVWAAVIVYWYRPDEKTKREFMPHFLRAMFIGFGLTAIIFFTHSVSGANFNPWRFLGPALLALDLGPDGHIYIWPPLVGAVIAGIAVGGFLYLHRPESKTPAQHKRGRRDRGDEIRTPIKKKTDLYIV